MAGREEQVEPARVSSLGGMLWGYKCIVGFWMGWILQMVMLGWVLVVLWVWLFCADTGERTGGMQLVVCVSSLLSLRAAIPALAPWAGDGGLPEDLCSGPGLECRRRFCSVVSLSLGFSIIFPWLFHYRGSFPSPHPFGFAV